MESFFSDAETMYEPESDLDSLLSDDITFRTANSRAGRNSSLEEGGYQPAGRTPSPSAYPWYPQNWRRMVNNTSSVMSDSSLAYVPDTPTSVDVYNSLAARRIHEEYFQRPRDFSKPPEEQFINPQHTVGTGQGNDEGRRVSSACSNGSPVGVLRSSAMQSAIDLCIKPGRTSRSNYSLADTKMMADAWSREPIIVGMATTPDIVGPILHPKSPDGSDEVPAPEDQAGPGTTAENDDHASLYEASDNESTPGWMCLKDTDLNSAMEDGKNRKRQGQGLRQFPPREHSSAVKIEPEWQRGTGFRYLTFYKDIRVMDYAEGGFAMTIGSMVICVGDTLTEEWPDTFTMQPGDVYVILQMFGDMWASCIKVSTVEPLELGDSVDNPRKDSYWVIPQSRVGFLPLCALTIAANFGDYMARHPRTSGHKIFKEGPYKNLESTPAGGRTVVPPPRTFSRDAALKLERGGSVMVPPRVLDTCALYRMKRSTAFVAARMDETDAYNSFGHVSIERPQLKKVKILWELPDWRDMLRPIEKHKVNKTMPITNIAVELAAEESRAISTPKQNTPKQDTLDIPGAKFDVGSSKAQQDMLVMQTSQATLTPSRTQRNMPATQVSKSIFSSSSLVEDTSETSIPHLEQDTPVTSGIDFVGPGTHDVSGYRMATNTESGDVPPKSTTEGTVRRVLGNKFPTSLRKRNAQSAESDTHSDQQTITQEPHGSHTDSDTTTVIGGAGSALGQRTLRQKLSVRLPSRRARRNTASSDPASRSESRPDEPANLSQSMTISRGSTYNRIHKAFKGSLGKRSRQETSASSQSTADPAGGPNESDSNIVGEENLEPAPSEPRGTVRGWRSMFHLPASQPPVPQLPTAQQPSSQQSTPESSAPQAPAPQP